MANVPPVGASVAEVAAAIAAKPSPTTGALPGVPHVQRQYGVVKSIQSGPPRTLTITLAGSTTQIAGVAFAAHYSPAVNDTVIVDHVGADLLVSGTQQGSANYNVHEPLVGGSTGSFTGAVTAPNFHGVADSATTAGAASGVITASGASNVPVSTVTGRKIASGSINISVSSGVTAVSGNISFGVTFGAAPSVTFGALVNNQYDCIVTMVSNSTTGCSVRLKITSATTPSGNITLYWIAMG